MTESEARDHAVSNVPRETADRLDIYHAALTEAAKYQNLVAPSTIDSIWSRHILDSAQLVDLAPSDGAWIDLGSGAGLPGLIVATLSERPVILVEPRAKRCAFLRETADRMNIASRVTVLAMRAETAPIMSCAVISARAVAPLPSLFAMGGRFARPTTKWLLMKGRTVAEEVAAARMSWHARISLVPSVTDSEAAIVVATEVRPRKEKRT